MKHAFLAVAAALTVFALQPAVAAVAPFACDAPVPKVCHFRLYFTPRGTRDIVLPAGMREGFPGVTIGRDHYCVSVDSPLTNSCIRKLINDSNNR
ncbi:MAG: hypothetical protein JO366_12725 [Methylobacteriaceae bacterium]|nr:hypothetical protein [Methylobacteriaceae bacterium]MBV9705243.1 hypothetical protein [Methylobacteriaceae bacterium]